MKKIAVLVGLTLFGPALVFKGTQWALNGEIPRAGGGVFIQAENPVSFALVMLVWFAVTIPMALAGIGVAMGYALSRMDPNDQRHYRARKLLISANNCIWSFLKWLNSITDFRRGK
ncbi:hypothetical protein [Shinella sp.]|uniref:hypothetical protein n=1 Tax=Shinella sp. TaxID=1870904 RepID=UPI004035B59A